MDNLAYALFFFFTINISLSGQELSENNAADWGVFDASGLTNNVSDNSNFVQVGNYSIEFNSNSGFQTGLFYPDTKDASWDLTNMSLAFDVYALNSNANGFQKDVIFRLHTTDSDYFEYERTGTLIVDQWNSYEVPLDDSDPCAFWQRTQVGNPSLATINFVEFEFDTWDFGFDLYLDGVEFINYSPDNFIPAQNEYVELTNALVVLRNQNGNLLNAPLVEIQAVTEEVSLFFWRHSKQSLNLKWDIIEIAANVDVFGIGDQLDPAKVETLLLNEGVVNDQFDAVLVTGTGIGNFGWTSGAYQLLGKAGFGQFGWLGSLEDDTWTTVHEFNHTMDGLMNSAGFAMYPHNHPAIAFANGEFVPNSGPNFDLNAKILQSLSKADWFKLIECGVWGLAMSFEDADGDGFADDDSNVPLDEVRFGSNFRLVDTDNDGLSDLEESYAGVFLSADPLSCDSDGDNLVDGFDPEVLYSVSSKIDYKESIPGNTNFGDYVGIGSQSGVNLYANFDESRLYFAIENNPFIGEDFSVSFDLHGDGLFYGRDNVTLFFQGNTLVNAELHDESATPIITSLPLSIFVATVANGGADIFIAIQESMEYDFVSIEGTEIGFRFVGAMPYQSSLFDLDDYAQFILCGSAGIDNRVAPSLSCAAGPARCPFITCPESVDIVCSEDAIPGPIAIDTICSLADHTIDISGPVITGDPNCPGATFTFTYIVSDLCANIDTCIQVFVIENDGPTLDCPDDRTIECSDEVAPANPNFTVSCGTSQVITTGPVIDGDPDCPGTTYTYTYTVTDICGRSVSCDQVLTIMNDDPVLQCPMDKVIECSDEVAPENPSFTTSCGDGVLDITGPIINGDPDCSATTYTYTYTVTDVCGRSVTCDQVLTIVNDDPVLVCPIDKMIVCSDEAIAENPSFTTSCGDGMLEVTGPVVDGDPDCPGTTHTYTYTVTDVCGRIVTCTQVYTIGIGAPPVLECPDDEIVLCVDDIIVGDVTYDTTCGVDATVDLSGPAISQVADCIGVVHEYTFTITDACNRESVCVQTFTVQDATPPVITVCPPDQAVACENDIMTGMPVYTTYCGVNASVEIAGPLVVGDPNCDGTTYEYTYIITDECGLSSTCPQVFTIQNGPPPMIECPADQIVDCAIDIVTSMPIYTTTCGVDASFTVEMTNVTGVPDCPGTVYEYTYTVTDACGRVSTCIQTFTINAGDAPSITECPDDKFISCEEDIILDDIQVTTSCGVESTIEITGPVVVGSPNCPGTTYTYTYIVTDACLGSSTCVQVFTIDAGDGPIIMCPGNSTVSCESEIRVPFVSYTTSCGVDATVTKTGPVVNGDPTCDGTTYTYTHTVTDACGRTATCIEVITISNTCKRLDFDLYPAATIISSQYPGVHISTHDNHDFPAMIFDTGNPTGNDYDIGTPNEMYGGPGIGLGFCNAEFQGNALIISKDRHIPNETEGTLIFEFDCAVLIRSIDFIDMECGHNTITLYNMDNEVIEVIDLPQFGENSFHVETIDIGGVYRMEVEFPCAGGAISDVKYCEDMTPGSMCGLCESATLDFSEHGYDWVANAMSGSYTADYQTFDIEITDPDNIFVDSEESMAGIDIGIDPHDVHDILPITYNLSEVSNNVIFDIVDLDFKDSGSMQQEQVCICGFLDGGLVPIYPTIISLDGSVVVDGNCAYATANSAVSHQDESILVNFKECVDQIVIKYGTGPHSPTSNPTYSKIVVGKNYGFTTETCPGVCEPCGLIGDVDGDGICDDCDICLSGDDTVDSDGDGLPDACDGDCIGSVDGDDDDADGVCNADDICPGGNDNIDLDGNGVPDECEECFEYKLVFGCTNEWVDNSVSGTYTVLEQTFDINIMDMDNILVDTEQEGFGLKVGIDPHDVDDVVLIKYTLSEIASSVMFDIVDLDYKDSGSMQHEAVCVVGYLGDDPIEILPTITSLEGSVAIMGNCAEGTTNSAVSHEDESIMVVFDQCVDQIVIEYGTGSNSPTIDPSYSKITIGLDLGFKTEVCEHECIVCEEVMNLVGDASDVHYQVSNLIESVQRVQGNEVIYDAGQSIILHPDFEVMGGAAFEAFIEGCEEN